MSMWSIRRTSKPASAMSGNPRYLPNDQETRTNGMQRDPLGTGLVVEDHVQERAVHMQL